MAGIKFYLDTDHPVALDSPDHIEPRSTARDNSINLAFNKRLFDLFDNRLPTVLDLGCAGGGMVRSFIQSGAVAVGLEGSDYNLVHQRAEWATIPDYLFTCDIGYPFTLHLGDGKPFRFDVITAWEFLEHIPEDRVGRVLDNISRHIKAGGLVIGSISDNPSVWVKSKFPNLDHHQTKKPLWWWNERFNIFYFKRRTDLETHFNVADAWVRKVKYNFVFQEDEL